MVFSVLARDIWSTRPHLYGSPPESQSRNKRPANIPQMRPELWTGGPDKRYKKEWRHRWLASAVNRYTGREASAIRSPCTNTHAEGFQPSLIVAYWTGLLLPTLKPGLFCCCRLIDAAFLRQSDVDEVCLITNVVAFEVKWELFFFYQQ